MAITPPFLPNPYLLFEPKINFFPPLKKEVIHFLECVKKIKIPLTDGNYALKISKIIEKIEKAKSRLN